MELRDVLSYASTLPERPLVTHPWPATETRCGRSPAVIVHCLFDLGGSSPVRSQLPAFHHSPSAFHHTPPIPNQIAMLTTLITAPNLHQSPIVT